MISDADAQVLKNAISAETKTWHVITVASAAAAVAFINLAPAQGAGEAFVCCNPNGTVELFYFL